MNLNDIFGHSSTQRRAKERALEELCQEEAIKKFNESDWKTIIRTGIGLAIPTAIASLMSSYGGLEYVAANAQAMITPNAIFSAGAFGTYKYLKNKGKWNLETQKKTVVNNYKEIIEENFSFNISKLSATSVIHGLVSLGLATLAYKAHIIPDFSGNVVLGAGLVSGGINYCVNYVKQSKMKKRVDEQAWKIRIEMEVEMRKEREKKEKEEKERRRRYEEAEKEYQESFKNFQDAFNDFQREYGSNGSRSKRRYYDFHYEERGSSDQRRPLRSSQISNSQAFATLGITRSIGYEGARSSFRKLAMQYHPDRNKGDKNAEAKFKEISQAWEIVEKYYKTG